MSASSSPTSGTTWSSRRVLRSKVPSSAMVLWCTLAPLSPGGVSSPRVWSLAMASNFQSSRASPLPTSKRRTLSRTQMAAEAPRSQGGEAARPGMRTLWGPMAKAGAGSRPKMRTTKSTVTKTRRKGRKEGAANSILSVAAACAASRRRHGLGSGTSSGPWPSPTTRTTSPLLAGTWKRPRALTPEAWTCPSPSLATSPSLPGVRH
mmetsp:Transcript_24700/g.72465  ORF Transcript_24700/g.72465 Transcript_24700/m.72465 type:complete len:206 (-) Transcript_24700:75-692(-)